MVAGLIKINDILPVQGITLACTSAGLYKVNRDDVCLIRLSPGSCVSAVFTRNKFAAAPVNIAKKHLSSNVKTEYLLINAGNANAGLGIKGEKDAIQTCEYLSAVTNCNSQAVLPFSTGVIGEALPVNNIQNVLQRLVNDQNPDSWLDAARAIMTTDTVPKAISQAIEIDGKKVTVTGIAKGSGMIRPDMATMLAFIGTDANIENPILTNLLNEVIQTTFNRITVDGDTSTNDACVIMATAIADNQKISDINSDEYAILKDGVHGVCEYLAQTIVRDGEGATKFIQIEVSAGNTPEECLQVAYAISHSPLVKTAFFASDPNWGRILAAVGKAGINDLELSHVNIHINDCCIVQGGSRHNDYTEEQGKSVMSETDIILKVSLGRGNCTEIIWTCDLSHDYVSINADYRS